MCGFVGIVTNNNEILKEYESTSDYRLNLISHRGPDGSKTLKGKDYMVGHVILSIQGTKIVQNQPYSNERYVMVYNGEILNLKYAKSIIKKYIPFNNQDDSDTPILFYGLINEVLTFLII